MQNWHITYYYEIYDVPEEEIKSNYLNKYFKAVYSSHYKTIKIIEVDEITSLLLYNKKYNPISFTIWCQPNVGSSIIFMFNLTSIDKIHVRGLFECKNRKEALHLRTKMYKYFYENKIVNALDLKNFVFNLDNNVDFYCGEY